MFTVLLLFQIIHFWIAYLILSRIFLRSALKHIHAEDAQRQALEQLALLAREEVELKEASERELWRHRMYGLMGAMPDGRKIKAQCAQIPQLDGKISCGIDDERLMIQGVKRIIVDALVKDDRGGC